MGKMKKRWFEYRVAPGVRDDSPFVYEWHVAGKGSGFGESGDVLKNKKDGLPERIHQYHLVIQRHLRRRPYRPSGRPYRAVHDNLAHAVRADLKVTLTIIENIADRTARKRRDIQLNKERGVLNYPMAWSQAIRDVNPTWLF